MTPASESKSAARARRTSAAARRRVIMAALIAVVAAAGVMWVARPVDDAVDREAAAAAATAGLDAGRTADDAEEVALPIPPSDADVLLVNGAPAGIVRAESLRQDAPTRLDLAAAARFVGGNVLTTRVMSEGREMLELEGRVGGPDRNVVRIDVPAGWFEPGSYLIEVRTGETSHAPLRRFALIVD